MSPPRYPLLAVLLLSLLATPVRAHDVYARPGTYVAASATLAIENLEGSSQHDLSAGFQLRLGYRASEIFSTEIEIDYAHGFDDSPGPEDTVGIYVLTANLKASAPLGRLQPFGLLGLGFSSADFQSSNPLIGRYDSTDGAAKLGLGLDYYLTRYVVLSASGEYNFVFSRGLSLDFMTLGFGAAYRF